jgi:hypothetical protein
MTKFTLIGEDRFCRYYYTSNPCLRGIALRVYNGGEDIESMAMRTMDVFTQTLAVKEMPNTLEHTFQRKVLALSEIDRNEYPQYMGRVLLVRETDKMPVNCIITDNKVLFVNDQGILSLEEASVFLQEWLSSQQQYDIVDPLDFLSKTKVRLSSGFEIIDGHLKSKELNRSYSTVSLGIEIDEKGNSIPVWMGHGVVPSTSTIFYNGRIIESCHQLAEIITDERI